MSRLLKVAEIFSTGLIVSCYFLLLSPLLLFDFISVLTLVIASVSLVFSLLLLSSVRLWWKYRKTAIDSDHVLYQHVHQIAEEFSIVRNPAVVILKSPSPNAYAIDSLFLRPRIVITDSLLRTLDKREVDAVIAHELSHIAHQDSLYISTLGSLVSTVEKIHIKVIKFMYTNYFALVIFLPAYVLTKLITYISYISFFFLSRIREYAADADAGETVGDQHVISALQTLQQSNQNITYSNIDEEALCIVPISPDSRWFSTHPKTEKRIDRLS